MGCQSRCSVLHCVHKGGALVDRIDLDPTLCIAQLAEGGRCHDPAAKSVVLLQFSSSDQAGLIFVPFDLGSWGFGPERCERVQLGRHETLVLPICPQPELIIEDFEVLVLGRLPHCLIQQSDFARPPCSSTAAKLDEQRVSSPPAE